MISLALISFTLHNGLGDKHHIGYNLQRRKPSWEWPHNAAGLTEPEQPSGNSEGSRVQAEGTEGPQSSPSWADCTHPAHQHPPWKPNGSGPTSLAFLNSALCKIQNLGLARERGSAIIKKSGFVCLFVCLNASKELKLWYRYYALTASSQRFLRAVFSFSIRGFPATVRVAVHLLTLLKHSHFSIPWASS